MAFQNSILAGTALVRPAIHSPNYVPGTSGWTINQDGSAEFMDLSIRGEFSTGPAGSPHIIISDSAAPPFSGVPRMALYSGDPQETQPAFVANFQNAGVSWFEIDTSNDGFGINQLIGIPPQSAANSGGWLFATTASGTDIGHVELDTDMQLRILNPNNCSLTSTDHGFQVGPTNSFNIIIGDAQIQKRNNGVASALLLNESGGNVTIGDGTTNGTVLVRNPNSIALATDNQGFQIGDSSGINLIADRQAIQARINGVATDLLLNYYGGNIGLFTNNAGVLVINGSINSPIMRALQGLDNAVYTTISTAFVALGPAANVTLVVPSSGSIIVNAEATNYNNTAGNSASFSFEIRLNNAAGAVLVAAGAQGATFMAGLVANANTTSSTRKVTGLTPGSTVFVRFMARSSNAANTATFQAINIIAIPLT